jgi:hypothetical protein
MVPMAHVGAGLAGGVILQVSVTPVTLNPLTGVVVMVDVAEPGGVTVRDDGETESVKLGEPMVSFRTGEVLELKLESPL